MSEISGSYTANLVGTIKSHLAGLQGYDVMAVGAYPERRRRQGGGDYVRHHGQGLLVHNSGRFSYCGDLEASECKLHATDGISCDYHRIVDVASGEQTGQSDKIGRFGIGFVSVYQITDLPGFSPRA